MCEKKKLKSIFSTSVSFPLIVQSALRRLWMPFSAVQIQVGWLIDWILALRNGQSSWSGFKKKKRHIKPTFLRVMSDDGTNIIVSLRRNEVREWVNKTPGQLLFPFFQFFHLTSPHCSSADWDPSPLFADWSHGTHCVNTTEGHWQTQTHTVAKVWFWPLSVLMARRDAAQSRWRTAVRLQAALHSFSLSVLRVWNGFLFRSVFLYAVLQLHVSSCVCVCACVCCRSLTHCRSSLTPP